MFFITSWYFVLNNRIKVFFEACFFDADKISERICKILLPRGEKSVTENYCAASCHRGGECPGNACRPGSYLPWNYRNIINHSRTAA